VNMAKKAKPGVRKPKATQAKKKPSFDRIVYRIEDLESFLDARTVEEEDR